MIRFRSIEPLDKHPSEVLFRGVDFEPWLQAGESLAAGPVEGQSLGVAVPAGSGLTADQAAIAGTTVNFRLQAGTPRTQTYWITLTAPVTGGVGPQVYVAELELRVDEA